MWPNDLAVSLFFFDFSVEKKVEKRCTRKIYSASGMLCFSLAPGVGGCLCPGRETASRNDRCVRRLYNERRRALAAARTNRRDKDTFREDTVDDDGLAKISP